jgi:cytochrome c553
MKTVLLAAAALGLAGATDAVQAQDRNQARNLSAQCANCHGTNGVSQGGMPPLAGMDRNAFIAQMNAFKSGARSGPAATIMHQLAKGYSDEQIALMAGYFAAQKPAK